MGTCERCGREVEELAYSHAAGAVVCERCHCKIAPPVSAAARRYRAPQPPAPAKPSPYARLHRRVWAALERNGDVFPACDGSGRIAGTCPSCGQGAVGLQLVDNPPRVGIRLPCSLGCTDEFVIGSLR